MIDNKLRLKDITRPKVLKLKVGIQFEVSRLEVKLVFISSSSLGFERGECQFPSFCLYSFLLVTKAESINTQ